MKSLRVLTFALTATLLIQGPASAKLTIGDAAPPLKIAEWIKGEPVELSAGAGKTIYVVEFWATWCGPCRESIPHLSRLQQTYKDKNVVFIGISSEPVETIQPFVRQMGERMEYTVAADRDEKTSMAYLAAAGLTGIPHAFVVGKDGRIAWHGHPAEKMEAVLDELIAGTYDIDAAKARMEKLDALDIKLEEAYVSENWDEVLRVAEQINEVQPDPVRYQHLRFHAMALKGDMDGASSSGVALLESVSDANTLNSFAWMLLTDDQFKGKFNALALRVAAKANELSAGENWSVLDTYARALFETGDVNGAIEHQKKAIQLAEGGSVQAAGELKAALARYEAPAREKAKE